MALITFHMQNGQRVEGNVPFQASSVQGAVGHVEINHPKLIEPVKLFGAKFCVFNEKVVVPCLGSLITTFVLVFDGMNASGYRISPKDIEYLPYFDLSTFHPRTLELITKHT